MIWLAALLGAAFAVGARFGQYRTVRALEPGVSRLNATAEEALDLLGELNDYYAEVNNGGWQRQEGTRTASRNIEDDRATGDPDGPKDSSGGARR